MSCNTCNKSKCCCVKTRVINKYGPSGKNGKKSTVPGPQGPPGEATVIITVARTAFVMKNGSDSTGLVERFDKPFLTFQAATNALNSAFPSRTATNRCMVVGYEGEYTGTLYFSKFIDYHFGNITFNGTLGDNGVDLGATEEDQWTNIITGNARFVNSANANAAFYIQKPNTKVLAYCDEIGATLGDSLVLADGLMRLHCNRIWCSELTSDFNFAIEMAQGYLSTAFTFSKLEVIGADIYNYAGAKAAPISFTSEGEGPKNQVLTLINCRVKSNSNYDAGAASPITVGMSTGSDGELNLFNCVLETQALGAGIKTFASHTATIKYYGTNMSNKVITGPGTNTVVVGTLTVDAAVQTEF